MNAFKCNHALLPLQISILDNFDLQEYMYMYFSTKLKNERKKRKKKSKKARKQDFFCREAVEKIKNNFPLSEITLQKMYLSRLGLWPVVGSMLALLSAPPYRHGFKAKVPKGIFLQNSQSHNNVQCRLQAYGIVPSAHANVYIQTGRCACERS